MAHLELPDGDGTNMERLFERDPAVLDAWKQLNGSIKASMELRLYEIATLAAAAELRSSYCSLAHGKVLYEDFGVAPGDPLDDADQAVQRFARKMVRDASAITPSDVDELRAHGLNDDDIFGVMLAVGARCFLSKTLDAAGVQPDAFYRDLPDELREPLIVGRPIAEP